MWNSYTVATPFVVLPTSVTYCMIIHNIIFQFQYSVQYESQFL